MTFIEKNDFVDNLNIEEIVSKSICEDLGIILEEYKDNKIKIGAMNPNFSKVIQFLNKLKNEYDIEYEVCQISSEAWESKFADINKNNLQQDVSKRISLRENFLDKELENLEKNLSIKANCDENSLEDINNEKYDFFDTEEEEESIEIEDIFDSSEFEEKSDPVITAVGSILSASEKLGASDIHAEPLEQRMRIRYRVDGVLQDVYTLPKARSKAIVSRIKVMSKLDIAEKRLPQDGRLRYRTNEKILDFRVSTLPGKWGEKIVLRSLQSDTSLLKLEKLITTEEELKAVRSMGNLPYGIFIVVGPTGSGKSTSLYSILNERNVPDVNIITVEDPVEYTLDGIHQVQVLREKGLDFARALRAIMRQDPDIILVGETRDKETAHTAMEAALTGHMVFTTLHANDTATAIARLNEMGVPPYLIGSSIVGVMAQRLVRKVCPNCCRTRNVNPDKDRLASSYGIKTIKEPTILDLKSDPYDDTNKRNLCNKCNGSGYKGRIGLYEVMRVNDSIRELIMSSSNAEDIRSCAYQNGVKSLLVYGMELVKRGITTIQEVERVCLLEDSGND